MTAATVTVGTRRIPSAALALARVESVRVVTHPATLVRALATALLVNRGFAVDPSTSWAGADYSTVLGSWFPLWLGLLIAGALTAGRGRMLDDPDLFSGVPVPPATRVAATIVALLTPALLACAGVAVTAAAVDGRGGFHLGTRPYSDAVFPPFVEWAQIPLTVLLAGVVGVTIAQLPRWRMGALLAASTLTFLGSSAIWIWGATPLRTYFPFMFRAQEHELPASYQATDWNAGDDPLIFPNEYTDRFREVHLDSAASLWHLVYLAGLILAVAWLAIHLAGGGRRWRWLAAGVPIAVVGGVAQFVAAGPLR